MPDLHPALKYCSEASMGRSIALRQQVGPGAAQGTVTLPRAHGDAVTDIAIQPLTATNQTDLNRCDNSFTVEADCI